MTNPNAEEGGFIASTGFEISVTLIQTIYRRIPKLYREDCMNYGTKKNNFVANKIECIRRRIQAKIFEKCRCIDPSLGVVKSLRQYNFTDVKDSCCIEAILNVISLHSHHVVAPYLVTQ
ncbi:hypothetical protein AVEN_140661-1 [Araneus ventricosus]|uniref:Uncharacterized protein n=1 Tax=Araneus ventricosus TaxID=182803 RepID=A0A4Y2C472_ARAVE|nr:hypothetical protein AVEN_140661-1 [Araneus ventricosus]